MRGDGLPGEVRLALDKLEIMELNARYNRAYADRDVDAFVACFTADGVYELVNRGQAWRGRDAIRELIEATMSTPAGGVQHMTTDAIIDVGPDRAQQVCSVLLYRRESPENPNDIVGTGTYRDELVRTSGGWRYSHRRTQGDGRLRIHVPTGDATG